MLKIFKYPIKKEQNEYGDIPVEMPFDAEILTIADQNGEAKIWAKVDPEADTETRYFKIVGTGHDVPEGYFYITTFHQGSFVWHVFEKED